MQQWRMQQLITHTPALYVLFFVVFCSVSQLDSELRNGVTRSWSLAMHHWDLAAESGLTERNRRRVDESLEQAIHKAACVWKVKWKHADFSFSALNYCYDDADRERMIGHFQSLMDAIFDVRDALSHLLFSLLSSCSWWERNRACRKIYICIQEWPTAWNAVECYERRFLFISILNCDEQRSFHFSLKIWL